LGIPFRISLPERPDLIHVHTTGPIGMAGFRLAASLGVPLVMTWHTDLLAYADVYPEIPTGAAWCAVTLRLGWSARDYLELAQRGTVRHQRLVVLARAMFARMSGTIAPSGKTAASFAEFASSSAPSHLATPHSPLPEICVLPTPVLRPEEAAPPTHLREGPVALPDGPVMLSGGPVAALDDPVMLPAGPVAPLDDPVMLPGGPVAALDGPVVLSVGRVSAEKDPSLLLRTFALVAAAKPGARLVLVGVRLHRRRLRRMIAALGLTSRVTVIPPVPHEEVAGYYRTADVLAFSSTTDTQSLVLSEAEAAGLPVVAADPLLASRPDGSLRVTCPPTPSAFAAALLRLLGDPVLHAQTAKAGLAATAAYPPSAYVTQLTALYERCFAAAARLNSRSEKSV
jgi:glycosyltransferase involved in cell wall biosynthesis